MQRTVLHLPVNSREVSILIDALWWVDKYVLAGGLESGLDKSLGSSDIEEIETQARLALSAWAEKRDVSMDDVEIDLGSHMRGKSLDK